jgi:glycosyltransferase involved in cell wall biosynthesis
MKVTASGRHQPIHSAYEPIAAVIPCHNYGHYLEQCLRSVETQTIPFAEVVIIDDASTDNTPEIARSFLRRHPDWQYHRISAHQVAVGRNTGVALTRAPLIAHIDADNWVAPTFVEYLSTRFVNQRVGLVYPHLVGVTENGEPHPTWKSWAKPFDYHALRRQNFIDTCAVSRRVCHETVGGWKPVRRLADWLYHLELTRAGWTGLYVPEDLVYYRSHADSMSRSEPRERDWQNHVDVMTRGFKLAIVTPFAGRTWALERYIRSLQNLPWDKDRIHLIAVDNSEDPEFAATLRELLHTTGIREITYINCPTEHPGAVTAQELAASARLRLDNPSSPSETLVQMYQAAKNHLGDADIVLTWEDDIEPAPDALPLLLSTFTPGIAGASAVIRSRFHINHEMVKDIVSFNPFTIRTSAIPEDPIPFPTECTGFGFLLTRREVWDRIRMRVHPSPGSARYPYFDYAFMADLKRLGYKIVAHNGVRPKHWQANGTFII